MSSAIPHAPFARHARFEGVFLRPVVTGDDSTHLASVEALIVPDHAIDQHIHDASDEHFFFIDGTGELYDGTAWRPVTSGDAIMPEILRVAAQAGWSTPGVAGLAPAFDVAAKAGEPVRPRVVSHLLDELVDADTNPTVTDLAARVGLSPAYLSRACARYAGLPPHQLMMQRRLRQAQTFLADGMTPADAAHLAGFYDQSHLNREFRRGVGVTPTRYQAAVHTSDDTEWSSPAHRPIPDRDSGFVISYRGEPVASCPVDPAR